MDKKQIKYRAWYQGKMYPVLTLDTREDALAYAEIRMPNKIMWVVPEDIMQWTGMNDKRGIEVFEGDLVKFFVGAPWDNEQPLEVIAKVEYDNPWWGCFCVNSLDDYPDERGCLYEYIDVVRVVGNIHEGIYSPARPQRTDAKNAQNE